MDFEELNPSYALTSNMRDPMHATDNFLPQRHATHQLEALSISRFRGLFREPLFLVRDEPGPDYGVDLSIEALEDDGRLATNIRSFVQLKATEKYLTARGEMRLNIKISNVNYMVNSHSSFYCVYLASSDNFLFRSSIDVLDDLHRRYPKIPNYKKLIGVSFSEVLDQQRISQIHSQMIAFATTVKAVEKFYADDSCDELVIGKHEPPPDIGNVANRHAYRVDEFGNRITMEHEVWERHRGKIPSGFEVFHKNGQTLDNRRDNLGLRPIDPRRFTVGIFPSIADNIAARNIFRVILHGDQATQEDGAAAIVEPILFWEVIRELQRQGMSMKQEDVEAYKRECIKVLQIEF
jgi:hypothetical protein